MTLLSDVEGMLRAGKPFYALNLIKQYVEDMISDKSEIPERCRHIIEAVRVMPWLNDESWRYFAAKMDDTSIQELAVLVSNCIRE
jgi:hypothetical protein